MYFAFSATQRVASFVILRVILQHVSSSIIHVRTQDDWALMRPMPTWQSQRLRYVCASSATQVWWLSPTFAMVRRLLRRWRESTSKRIAPPLPSPMQQESISMVAVYKTVASHIVANALRLSIPTAGPMAVLLRQLRSIGQQGAMLPCLTPSLPVPTTSEVRIRTRWQSVTKCLISTSSWWLIQPQFLCFKIIISWPVTPSYCQSLLSMRATSMPITETIGKRQPKKVRESFLKTASDM